MKPRRKRPETFAQARRKAMAPYPDAWGLRMECVRGDAELRRQLAADRHRARRDESASHKEFTKIIDS